MFNKYDEYNSQAYFNWECILLLLWKFTYISISRKSLLFDLGINVLKKELNDFKKERIKNAFLVFFWFFFQFSFPENQLDETQKLSGLAWDSELL